ncbi:MAG TPA: hypothetical protein VEZ90_03425, partial [Blastocatellia bacterium]|nr:hypothetical protein [Blastocatellia bacterium]
QQLAIPGQGAHDVLFVATEHDSVYAFDAGGTQLDPLWRTSLLGPGDTTVPASDTSCSFISPEVGITGTPVIDTTSGTLYVLARTKSTSSSTYSQRLHALDVATGAETLGGPVEIQASVAGNGDGSSGGQVAFDPLLENPRAGLLLANHKIYIAWASSCDVGPYHGWLMAYDATTLARAAVFNVSPNSSQGGIWQGDAAPAADAQGNVFVVTGNGGFDAKSGGGDYGDSVVKLSTSTSGFSIGDYFTPANQQQLDNRDLDLGSSGTVLLPDLPGPHPHELVVTGKGQVIYVIDRDNMGRFHQKNDNHAVQAIQDGSQGFGAPAYWNSRVYISLDGDNLKAFTLKANGKLSKSPAAQSPSAFNYPGCTPVISANGTSNGIVWAIENGGDGAPAILHAFDATNVGKELYNSQQNSGRDQAGDALRFTMPTVVQGRVYVGTSGEVDVYGLLSSSQNHK